MTRALEFLLVAAGALGVGWAARNGHLPPDAAIAGTLTAISLLVGALAGATSVLLSIGESSFVSKLRANGRMLELRSMFRSTFRACLFAVPTAIVTLVVKPWPMPSAYILPLLCAFWAGVTTWAFFDAFRILGLYLAIVETDEEDKTREAKAEREKLARRLQIESPIPPPFSPSDETSGLPVPREKGPEP